MKKFIFLTKAGKNLTKGSKKIICMTYNKRNRLVMML